MVKNDFLDAIKAFTEEAVGELILPCRVQSGNEAQTYRAADVYKMRLPDSTSAAKKAPYIIHAIITSSDKQPTGEHLSSTLQLRSVFCVYHSNEQEGALALLELMERFRVQLLKIVTLEKRYQLDLSAAMESLYYPAEDTAPYFLGETVSTWRVPTVEKEVSEWLRK